MSTVAIDKALLVAAEFVRSAEPEFSKDPAASLAVPTFSQIDQQNFELGESESTDWMYVVDELYLRHEDQFSELVGSVDSRYGALLARYTWGRSGRPSSSSSVAARAAVEQVVASYASEWERLEDAVDRTVAELGVFAESEEFRASWRFPIAGAELPNDEVALSPNAQLKSVDDAGRDFIWSKLGHVENQTGWPAPSVFHVANVRTELRIETTFTPTSTLPEDLDWNATSEAVRALRLAGAIDARQLGYWTEFPDHPTFLKWFCASGTGRSHEPSHVASDIVEIEDVRLVQALFKKLLELDLSPEGVAQPSSLGVAVGRFDLLRDRSLWADHLIDAWVGLEALFTSEGNSEMGYRAAMRIAGLIGESDSEKRQLRDRVPKLYSGRSALVHGTALKKPAEEFARESSELLRRALVRWILDWEPRGALDIDYLLLAGDQ